MSDVQQGSDHVRPLPTISNRIQALLSVFKGRTADSRNPESGIDRCDVSIEDQPDKVKCRMVVKMICRNGKFTRVKATVHITDFD